MLRMDKIKATAHVVSIKAHKALTNGNFVTLGKLDASAAFGVGEIFTATAPKAGDRASKVVLVAGVELMADEQYGIADYSVAKDAIVRGIVLEAGDVITVTNEVVASIVATPVVGAFVAVKDGESAKYLAALDGTETLALEVLDNTTLGGEKAVQLLVL